MRSSLAVFGKTALLVVLVSLMAVPSFAQISLRKAFDSDGDSKADFVIFRPANNVWYFKGSTGLIRTQQWGSYNDDHMVPGDYDNDGLADLAVWREPTGVWYVVRSSNGTFFTQTWGVSGDEPIARDYDADGRTDLAVVRRTGGNMIWYIVYSSTGSFDARQFGLSTDYTAPGDYNGDGRFDVAVQRPGASPTAASTFYYNTGTSFNVVNFGETRDLVVPGDYDGDGKTDIAVVREGATPTAELTWYIKRSTDGVMQVKTWGITATDLLAQNDYTGDGKTDLGVWRNSDGKFYIYDLANSGIQVTPWGEANDFPVASYDTH